MLKDFSLRKASLPANDNKKKYILLICQALVILLVIVLGTIFIRSRAENENMYYVRNDSLYQLNKNLNQVRLQTYQIWPSIMTTVHIKR